MKLKTLKDFEKYCLQDFIEDKEPNHGNFDAIVNFYELKQEAIKWIKELESNKYKSFCTKCKVFFDNVDDDPCYKPLRKILDKRNKESDIKQRDKLWNDYLKLYYKIDRSSYVICGDCYECAGEIHGSIAVLKSIFNIKEGDLK